MEEQNTDDPILLNVAAAKVKALQEEEDREKQTRILETEVNQPGCPPEKANDETHG